MTADETIPYRLTEKAEEHRDASRPTPYRVVHDPFELPDEWTIEGYAELGSMFGPKRIERWETKVKGIRIGDLGVRPRAQDPASGVWLPGEWIVDHVPTGLRVAPVAEHNPVAFVSMTGAVEWARFWKPFDLEGEERGAISEIMRPHLESAARHVYGREYVFRVRRDL